MNGIGLLFFFTFGLAFALSSTEVERNADEECTRFDDKPGYCVPRNSCSKMVNMIKRIKKGIPLTSDERLYISRSNCTPSKKRYVCCEEEEKLSEAIQNLTTADCGVFGIKKTIGGFEIKLMSRPWLALLYFRSRAGTNAFTCGGTLINQRYILTAAHCFSKQELLSVRLGEHRISQERDCALERGVEICSEAEDFDVERIFVHEKYAPLSGHNDIALVKLARDVTFKDNIKPICLPANEDLQKKINDMEIFHVTGWGKTETTFFSDVPMETVVNRSNHSTCQRSYSRDIVSSQLCAGGVGKDSCNGDSGGPLSYAVYHNGRQRFMQFGVVSFGSQVCGIGHPGVYTNVGSYSRWIAYKIATK